MSPQTDLQSFCANLGIECSVSLLPDGTPVLDEDEGESLAMQAVAVTLEYGGTSKSAQGSLFITSRSDQLRIIDLQGHSLW